MSKIRLTRPIALVGCGQVARGTEIDLTEPYNGGLVDVGFAEYVDPPAKKRVEVTVEKEPPEPTPAKREKDKEAK